MTSNSYLPDFETDVFISYTHTDNQPFGEDQERWIARLHSRLETRVEQFLGSKVSIFRDEKLQGNDAFAEVLLEQLEKVAALVCIVSPRYFQSEWCSRELTGFFQAAEQSGGLQVGKKARLFKVVKTPPRPEQYPDELQRLLGYSFFHEPRAGRIREFHLDPNPEKRREYWVTLDDLAQDVAHLLEEMRGRRPQPSPATSVRNGPAVYLAETTSDLSLARENIRRDLEQRGYDVLPDEPLSVHGGDLVASVRDNLAKSKLSVHLIGSRYGAIPEGEQRSIVQLQLEVAAQMNGRLQRLLWIPENLEPAEERQEAFLADLQSAVTVGVGTELLRTPLETLKTYMVDKLTAPPKTSASETGVQEPASIYLICDQRDFEAVQPLADCLQGRGFAVTLPLREGNEAEIHEDHRESLVVCDSVIIYYGSAKEYWLRTKLRDLRKVPGWGRPKPIEVKAVYLGPAPQS